MDKAYETILIWINRLTPASSLTAKVLLLCEFFSWGRGSEWKLSGSEFSESNNRWFCGAAASVAFKVEVEQAQFFQDHAQLKLWVPSPDEPKPMKSTIESASSLSFFLIKNGNFKLEPTSSF